MSLDKKKNRDQKLRKFYFLIKRKMYKNSISELNQNGNLLHTLVFSQVFQCIYYQRVKKESESKKKNQRQDGTLSRVHPENEIY